MSTDNEKWEDAANGNSDDAGKTNGSNYERVSYGRDANDGNSRPRRTYEGGDRQRSYRPRFNPNGGGRVWHDYNNSGEERPYRPRFNSQNGEGQEGRPQRYNSYNNYNSDDRQQQRPYRPRFNSQNGEGQEGRPQRYNSYNNNYNSGDGQQQQRPYRPRFNNQNGEGQEGRPQRYNNYNNYNNYNGGEGQQQRPYRPRFNNQNGEGQEGRPQRSYGGGYGNNGGGYGGGNNGYGRPQYRNGGYGQNNSRGGRFGGGNSYGRPQRQHSADYDPNAKYSKRKQIEYKELNADPDAPIRLNRYLANAGICSRREADEFIQAGVVSVNNEVVTELGTKVKRSDVVKFHDQTVNIERKVYVLLNKPKDTVTTTDDPQERRTVMDLVKDACLERIYPVGRLDRNTTGVLLLTNDGDLASKLTHPKFVKKKVYQVRLDKDLTQEDFDKILAGVELDDGEIHADALNFVDETKLNEVGIEIHSGKNRVVRRIFESLGYRVVKLDRVLFAGLTKKGLRRGEWRFLTQAEVNRLYMGSFE